MNCANTSLPAGVLFLADITGFDLIDLRNLREPISY